MTVTVVLLLHPKHGTCPVWVLTGVDAGERAQAWIKDKESDPAYKGSRWEAIDGVALDGDK